MSTRRLIVLVLLGAASCGSVTPAKSGGGPSSDSGTATGGKAGAAGELGTGGDTGAAGRGASGGAGGTPGVGNTPVVRSSTWAFSSDQPSVTCALLNVAPGDVLLAAVHSSGSPGVAMTAADSAGNIYQYSQDWGANIGVGAAFTKLTAAGDVDVTVSAGNTTAGLSLFCYDLAGVNLTPTATSATGSGTSCAVAVDLTTPQASIVVAIWAMYGSAASLTAGTGFTIAPGSPIAAHSNNYVASEFQVLGAAPSNCAMGMSVSQNWGGTCFAFSPGSR